MCSYIVNLPIKGSPVSLPLYREKADAWNKVINVVSEHAVTPHQIGGRWFYRMNESMLQRAAREFDLAARYHFPERISADVVKTYRQDRTTEESGLSPTLSGWSRVCFFLMARLNDSKKLPHLSMQESLLYLLDIGIYQPRGQSFCIIV